MRKLLLMFAVMSLSIISCENKKVEDKQTKAVENVDNNIYPIDGKISFAGIEWKVANNNEPQSMADLIYVSSDKNVFVDSSGRLHLRVSAIDGNWLGAELESIQELAFGEFSYTIETNLDNIDSSCIAVFSAKRPASRKISGMTELGVRIYGKPLYAPDGNIEYYMYSTEHKFALVEYPKLNTEFEKSNTVHNLFVNSDYFEYSTIETNTCKVLKNIKIDKKIKIKSDDEDKIEYAKPGSPLKAMIGFYLYDLEAKPKSQEVEIIISNFKFTPIEKSIASK